VNPAYLTPQFVWQGEEAEARRIGISPAVVLNATTPFADRVTTLSSLPSDYYAIFMSATDSLGRKIEGVSPYFTVVNANNPLPPLSGLTLLNPLKGTVWLAGRKQTIQWSINSVSSNNFPSKVEVFLLDPYTNATIGWLTQPIYSGYFATDVPGYNYTTWNVPLNCTNQRFRIRLVGGFEGIATTDPPVVVSDIFTIGPVDPASGGGAGGGGKVSGGVGVRRIQRNHCCTMASLTYTPIADIPRIVRDTRDAFNSHRTKSLQWRREQLLACYDMMVKKEADICAALNKDHHRQDPSFSFFQEIAITRNEIVYALENLDDWVAPEFPATSAMNATDRCEIRHDPLGVVLVIGPWNYPFHLTILPMVSALAAGNAVILKPSEVSSHTSQIITELIPQFMDRQAVQVINGGVAETTAVLAEKFDHIFYTGNGHVGRIVMTAAAKHLTPVTLELGGKSPVYVHSDADAEVAAKRVFWAKTNNSGQTCIAPDYLLIHKSVVPAFITGFKKAYKAFFGDDAQKSPLLSRIINRHHFNRLNKVLERQKAQSKSTVVVGGRTDADDLYIEPTLVAGVGVQDPIMEDELFGPMISIVEVEGVEEAIDIINARDHPLALYVFSDDKKVVNKILNETQSGSVVINDLLMNMIVPDLPFGGVGPSGMGSYHGKNGFLTFVHRRTTMWRPSGLESVNEVRYPTAASTPFGRKMLTMAIIKSPPSKLYLFLKRVGVFKRAGWVIALVVAFLVGRGVRA
ncbi:Aldehyde dehydrogenase, dimeric NADP-preferring, partial [Dinochytrium kinnereticum]